MTTQRVHVYRNLHRSAYSVRLNRYVIRHCDDIVLQNAKFVVQPAGRARVLREKRKNVHAYISGVVTNHVDIPSEAISVRYCPYDAETFVKTDDNEPVFSAKIVWLTSKGAFAIL